VVNRLSRPKRRNTELLQALLWVDSTSNTAMRSGIQQVVRNYAGALHELGIDVTLLRQNPASFTLEAQDYENDDSFSMKAAAPFSPHLMSNTGTKPVLLFFEVSLGDHLSAALQGQLLLRETGIPSLGLIHDLLPIELSHLYTPLQTLQFRRYLKWLEGLDLLCAISDETKASVQDYFAQTSEVTANISRDVVLLEHGVNDALPQFRKTGSSKDTDPFRIVFVSTVEPRKRQLLLLDTIKKLRATMQRPIHLTLIGSDQGYDKSYVESVEHQVKAHPDNTWLTKLGDAEKFSLIAEADVTCYLSDKEGFGLPVLESLQLGVPCIVSDSVPSGKYGGCIAVKNDREILAAALASLMSDNRLLDKLRRQCSEATFPSWLDAARKLGSIAASLRGPLI